MPRSKNAAALPTPASRLRAVKRLTTIRGNTLADGQHNDQPPPQFLKLGEHKAKQNTANTNMSKQNQKIRDKDQRVTAKPYNNQTTSELHSQCYASI